MPTTTIHVPPDLLESVDTRARAEGISRNRFILRALEKVLEEGDRWPPGFIEALEKPISPAEERAVDEMTTVISKSRRSKRTPPL